MNFFDLLKATLACGLIAFIIYSFPVVSQALLIGLLTLLWLGYARKVMSGLTRK